MTLPSRQVVFPGATKKETEILQSHPFFSGRSKYGLNLAGKSSLNENARSSLNYPADGRKRHV